MKIEVKKRKKTWVEYFLYTVNKGPDVSKFFDVRFSEPMPQAMMSYIDFSSGFFHMTFMTFAHCTFNRMFILDLISSIIMSEKIALVLLLLNSYFKQILNSNNFLFKTVCYSHRTWNFDTTAVAQRQSVRLACGRSGFHHRSRQTLVATAPMPNAWQQVSRVSRVLGADHQKGQTRVTVVRR